MSKSDDSKSAKTRSEGPDSDENPYKNPGGAARNSRDSSLYKGIYERTKSTEQRSASKDSGSPEEAQKKTPQGDQSFTFVLAEADPEVVPVEHRAVIKELTASLDSIDADRKALEAQLAGNNSANKLQIAQIKGRLADLRRRKLEIEDLLRASSNSDPNLKPG